MSARRGMDILERRIAPGAFHDSGRKYELPKCHLRTRTSILTMLSAWVDDAAHRGCGIVWLYGPSGSGKSSIAQTIAQVSFERGLLAASFFFDRNTPGLNTEKHLMATLAHQISNTVPEAGRFIAEAVEKDPGVFSGSLESQLQALIVGPLLAAHAAYEASLQQQSQQQIVKSEPTTTSTSSPTSPTTSTSTAVSKPTPKKWARLLVIDALDSCHGAAVQRYIVRILSTALIHKRVPLFILVSSRPLPPIRDSFNSYDLRELLITLPLDSREGYLPDSDIKRYFWSRFEYIRMTHPLRAYIPASWPTSQMIATLVARTAGQFVYASTVVKYVDSAQHRPVERLEAVMRVVPAGTTPAAMAIANATPGASASGNRGNDSSAVVIANPNGEVPFAELDALYRHVLGGVGNSKVVLRILGAILFAQRLYSSRSSRSSSASTTTSTLPSPISPNSNETEIPIPVTDPRFLEEILGLNRGDVPFMLQDLHSIVYVPDSHGMSSSSGTGGGSGAGRRQGVVQVGNVVQVHRDSRDGRDRSASASGRDGATSARDSNSRSDSTLVPAHGGGVGTPATGVSMHHHSHSHSHSLSHPHSFVSSIQPGTQVVAYGASAQSAQNSAAGQAQSTAPPYSAHTQAYGTTPGVYTAGSGVGVGGQIQAYGTTLTSGSVAGSSSGAGTTGSTTGANAANSIAVAGSGMSAIQLERALTRPGQPVLVAYSRGGQQYSPQGVPTATPAVGSTRSILGKESQLRESPTARESASQSQSPVQGHASAQPVAGPSTRAGAAREGGHSVGSPGRSSPRRATHGSTHSNGHNSYRSHPYDSSARHARSPVASSSHQNTSHPHHPPPRRESTMTSTASPTVGKSRDYGPNSTKQTQNQSGTVSSAPATSTGIRILHSSLIDFLTDRSRAGRYFINSVKVHAELARSCVRNLLSGHKYVHQYAGQALVTHCRYSVLTHELHADLLLFDIGIWITTCKTWSDGGYGDSVYANATGGGTVASNGHGGAHKSNGADRESEKDNSAAGRTGSEREKDVPRQPGFAVGPYDQAWIELPGLFHWFKTLTYTDPSKDLHTIHMTSWEQYLLNDLPRYAAHPGLEALLVFASIPAEPVAITSKSKSAGASLTSPTSPDDASTTHITSPTSPTSPSSSPTSSASTSAWSFDWLHIWPLLGIAPTEAASLEDEDRALLHFTGLRPGGGFDSYREMIREFLSKQSEKGKGKEIETGKGEIVVEADTVARVAECVCRYLMEPKKAGNLYPYRLPAAWTWFRAGHDDQIFRENRTKETFQAGLAYLPFLLMRAGKRESLIKYLTCDEDGTSNGAQDKAKENGVVNGAHETKPGKTGSKKQIRQIDLIRAKELPRIAWAEDKARAEEAISAYLERCENGAQEAEGPGDEQAMEVDAPDAPPTPPSEQGEDVPSRATVSNAVPLAVPETAMDAEAPATTTPRPPSTSPEGTAAATTASTTPNADAIIEADPATDTSANLTAKPPAGVEDPMDDNVEANTSGDVDMDAEGEIDADAEADVDVDAEAESDADADADADADTDPEGMDTGA